MIIYILTLSLVVADWLVPNAGAMAVVDGFLSLVLILIVGIYVIVRIMKEKRIKKGVKVLIAAASVLIMLFLSKNFVLDVVKGTEVITLNQVATQHYQGASGITSNHYYVIGIDSSGQKHRLEITADDYQILAKKSEVTVECYTHMRKVVKCW